MENAAPLFCGGDVGSTQGWRALWAVGLEAQLRGQILGLETRVPQALACA